MSTQAPDILEGRPSAPITVNGIAAGARDGIAITGEAQLTIASEYGAELVLVDAR